MRFGSVCSGIEAASVAFHPLGWRAAWLSEIEPFPSAVLAHHYPGTPNLGDMTGITRRVITGEVEAPDVLCGGTPCQAFSVAGLRESLNNDRGNLTLTFCELADAIDFARTRAGHPPAIVFWENVPGVLSTRDNAFGCFLAGLAGEDGALEPPGGKWTNAGCVHGPARTVAWRTLDAQYFGLAQRRRRVFVVASARDGFDPAQVLFEWDGVRRDSAPSREAGKDVAGSTGDGTARCVTAGEMKRQDWETCNFVAHSLRGEGFDASEGGTGRGTPLVPAPYSIMPMNSGKDYKARQAEVAQPLMAGGPVGGNQGGDFIVQPVGVAHAFDARQSDVIQNATQGKDQNGFGIGHSGDPMYTLDQGSQHAIAFDTYNQVVTGDVVQTLCSRGDTPGGNAHLVPAVAFTQNQRDEVRELAVAGALAAEPGMKQQTFVAQAFMADDYKDGGYEECNTARPLTTSADRTRAAPVIAFSGKDHGADAGEIAPTLRAMGHGASHANGGGQVAVWVAHYTGDVDASPSETDAIEALRALREAVGAQAFAEWGLGILDSLQPSEVLRQAVHGVGVRLPAFSRSWVVCCALGSPFSCSEGAVQSLREAGCTGCSPQGWEPPEQLARELGAYLSGLSHPGAQAERLMRDLWQAAEGPGVLRQALSAIQEARRPIGGQAQSAHAGMAVRRLTATECEFLQGFPRNYTAIQWRGKPANECPDGPRYKALGNSWAVPVARWIGERIQRQLGKKETSE